MPKNGCGFDYAFRYPGINKVLQAAGRVIRTTEDTGVILLLDERFWQREYDLLYPREWNDRKPCNIAKCRKTSLPDFLGSQIKNSSVDADTGIVVFTDTTIWRGGIFSFVFSTKSSLFSWLMQ